MSNTTLSQDDAKNLTLMAAVASHFHAYQIRKSMICKCDRDSFPTYQSIQDWDIPMFTRRWQNRSHKAAYMGQALLYQDKRCYIRGNLHVMFDVMMFQIIR